MNSLGSEIAKYEHAFDDLVILIAFLSLNLTTLISQGHISIWILTKLIYKSQFIIKLNYYRLIRVSLLFILL